jgi:hypothetical protein
MNRRDQHRAFAALIIISVIVITLLSVLVSKWIFLGFALGLFEWMILDYLGIAEG